MIRFDRFTVKAQEAAQLSATIIERYNHNQIDTEHMLLALLEQHDGEVPQLLKKMKSNINGMSERLDATLRASPKSKIVGVAKVRYLLHLVLSVSLIFLVMKLTDCTMNTFRLSIFSCPF